jgi:hypothetical protein
MAKKKRVPVLDDLRVSLLCETTYFVRRMFFIMGQKPRTKQVSEVVSAIVKQLSRIDGK